MEFQKAMDDLVEGQSILLLSAEISAIIDEIGIRFQELSIRNDMGEFPESLHRPLSGVSVVLDCVQEQTQAAIGYARSEDYNHQECVVRLALLRNEARKVLDLLNSI